LRTFTANHPLTDAETERLGDFLESCGGEAMNLEQLDGFLAALIAGPEPVMLSEYLPEVFGRELHETYVFEDVDEAKEIVSLVNRHWNTIAATLYKSEIYVPLLLKDEHGEVHGNDWAHGFLRGTFMSFDGWEELVRDAERGGCIFPMMLLHHEHDENPKMRPYPISAEERERLINKMAAGLLTAYQYFRERRELCAERTSRRTTRIGRNAPCPCGSGKKYKKCCGGAMVN
jgi:uncharacterized protein